MNWDRKFRTYPLQRTWVTWGRPISTKPDMPRIMLPRVGKCGRDPRPSVYLSPSPMLAGNTVLMVCRTDSLIVRRGTRKLHPAARALAHGPDRKPITGENSPSNHLTGPISE